MQTVTLQGKTLKVRQTLSRRYHIEETTAAFITRLGRNFKWRASHEYEALPCKEGRDSFPLINHDLNEVIWTFCDKENFYVLLNKAEQEEIEAEAKRKKYYEENKEKWAAEAAAREAEEAEAKAAVEAWFAGPAVELRQALEAEGYGYSRTTDNCLWMTWDDDGVARESRISYSNYSTLKTIRGMVNKFKRQVSWAKVRREEQRKEAAKRQARLLRNAKMRTVTDWQTWIDNNQEGLPTGLHLITTDAGEFVFTIEAGTVKAARSVSSESSGSDLWTGGKIISRNTGDIIILPYIRNSDNKPVNGYTRRSAWQKEFRVRTKAEEILWNAKESITNE